MKDYAPYDVIRFGSGVVLWNGNLDVEAEWRRKNLQAWKEIDLSASKKLWQRDLGS